MPVLESFQDTTKHSDVHVYGPIARTVDAPLGLESFDRFSTDRRKADVAEISLHHFETLALEFDNARGVCRGFFRLQVLVARLEQILWGLLRAKFACESGLDHFLFELNCLLPIFGGARRTGRAQRLSDSDAVDHRLGPPSPTALPECHGPFSRREAAAGHAPMQRVAVANLGW